MKPPTPPAQRPPAAPASLSAVPPRRFQFSLFTLMQIMLVVTVLGVVGGRLRPALDADRGGRITFVFFTLLGPMALLVALATVHAVWRWSQQRQRPSAAVSVRDSEPR